ncbi:MAG: PepSY domain-containing protein [Peptostreptococcus sp.]|uniref:PepSY domain-containing protein n=1 Tax=Peptostreptococcus sp. TaxID=1262 RepID=UPI002FC9CC21
MFLSKNASRKFKKGMILSACFVMLFSAVGCGSDKSESSKNNKTKAENILDVRTADIVGQQQAILRFTTDHKAGSIISIELKPSQDKYTYTVNAVDKKGIESIMTIDAKTSNVLKKEEKGPIDKNNAPGYIDFTPVLDVDKAAKHATSFASNKDMDQITAYKLYNDGSKNVYQFTLTDGAIEKAKTEKVLVDAVTGKKLDSNTSKDSNSGNANKSNTDKK